MTRVPSFLVSTWLIASSTPAFASEDDHDTGVHLGAAVGFVAGLAQRDTVATDKVNRAGASYPTVHLDIGWRVTEPLALYARGEAGFAPFVGGHAAVYGLVQWTAWRRVSIASGLGWDGMFVTGPDDCAKPCEGDAWSGISVPLVLAVDLVRLGQHAIRLDAEGAVGGDPSSGRAAWHSALTLGWTFH